MIPESFHFLRPAWLLALVPVALLLWLGLRSTTRASAWRRVVDEHLLRHLMLTDGGTARRWPLAAAGVALAAACVALAGPAWERVPQPTFTASQPVVVALDMSPSMAASDVRPSRLGRARHELHDVLERTRGGQVGLVLYTDDAFVASPLTDDARVIEEMVPSLEMGLMPPRPARADLAIARASTLLEQAGVASGDILLLTAGVDQRRDETLAAARAAAARGHRVSVLGVGERDGLDVEALEQLARAGGGRFAVLTADDADLEVVLPRRAATGGALAPGASSAQADVWRDAGVYLVLIPLLLAPLAFRRGLVAAVALALLAAAPARAEASVWSDLWSRRDQQAQRALQAGDPATAAQLFEDPAWKAAAQYESGDFAAAVEAYRQLPGDDNVYNLGNALARSGQLEEAIAAYDRVLASVPDHADAKFNRDLVQKLLDQRRQQEQQQQQQQQQQREPQEQSSGGGSQQENEQSEQARNERGQDESAQGQSGDGGTDAQASAEQQEPQSGSSADESRSADAGGEQFEPQPAEPQTAQGSEEQPESQQDGAQASARRASDDGASPEDDAADGAAARAEQNANDEQAEQDRSLAERLTQALQGDEAQDDANAEQPEEPREQAQGAGSGRPLTEREQAREQALRAIPDDPGGLLRAKIRRHYAEKRYSQREDISPW